MKVGGFLETKWFESEVHVYDVAGAVVLISGRKIPSTENLRRGEGIVMVLMAWAVVT